MGREFKVVCGNRVFKVFTEKEKAVMCARDCFELGFDRVCVTYKNWNPVPKTPCYTKTEERPLDKAYTITIMSRQEPFNVVREIKADLIKVIADENKIDSRFYREFYCNNELLGRYSSEEFNFDFGSDYWND